MSAISGLASCDCFVDDTVGIEGRSDSMGIRWSHHDGKNVVVFLQALGVLWGIGCPGDGVCVVWEAEVQDVRASRFEGTRAKWEL